MNKVDLGRVLASIPEIVSTVTYNYMGENGKFPRFSSVFKLVKADLKYEGIDYKKLSESDKYEIEEMARDAYEGMKEAGF